MPYQFTEPRRFDVIVFRYPDEAETYYIKRLVGLPNETVKIRHGDIYVKGAGDEDFMHRPQAARQVAGDGPDRARQRLRQPGAGRARLARALAGSRNEQDTRRLAESPTMRGTYRIDGTAAGDAWIRYEHTVPLGENWRDRDRGVAPRRLAAPAVDHRLLRLQYARAATRTTTMACRPALGLHWVGDLMLECELDVKSDKGTVLLDLVKGGRHFGCQIDVATGQAELSIEGLPAGNAHGRNGRCAGPARTRLRFANADRQLVLWVDDRLVEFDQPTTYDDLDNDRPQSDEHDPGDLAPVGIGSRGVALEVRHLRVLRDIYYIADR